MPASSTSKAGGQAGRGHIRTAMNAKTTALVALLMLSAGCTGGRSDNPAIPTVQPARTSTPTLMPTSTPTPKPIPTPLTIKQAASVYLAAVRPRNKALDKFDADWKASASVDTLRADAARMLVAERHFLEVLANTRWPTTIAENADNLATCIASSVSWYDANTRIKATSDILPPPPCGGGDAQLIRIRLQLPGR